MVKERKLNIISNLSYISDFFATTAEKMNAGTATRIEVALADSFLHYDQYSGDDYVLNVMEACNELYGSNPLAGLAYVEYPEPANEQAKVLQAASEAITAFCDALPEKKTPYNVKTTLFIAHKPANELTSQYEPLPFNSEYSIAYDD